MAGTDVVPFEASKYPVLDPSGQSAELLQVIADNMGDSEMGIFDLDRIKMPSGGGMIFEVPGLNGVEPAKAIEGVIVHWANTRSYWEKGLDEVGSDGTTPPDCSSDDGKIGHGMYGVGSDLHPSGHCSDCPMNAWESAPKGGRGKACSEQRLLFVLTEGAVLPVTMSMPPTSLKPIKQYFMRLAAAGKPFFGVVTKIGLLKAKNSQGIEYGVADLSAGDILPPEVRAKASEYRDQIKKQFEQVPAGAIAQAFPDEEATPAAPATPAAKGGKIDDPWEDAPAGG